ncbi:MAG: acylneuraminate cytidylyltransferase family protein [Anaerolineaceae bacterium]|nr:MAG: acylneuraminate cytidylyltransferase family protein [Anaerolineaceae bacterium]
MKQEVLAIIPARGGSKGIPRKNIRLIAGKPLIHYTVETALKCQALNRVVVSTEDVEIADLVTGMGSEVLRRPEDLAQDDTPMVPVIQHALRSLAEDGYQPEIIVLLQPTAPLRQSEHIDDCLELISVTEINSIVSVSPVPAHFRPDWQFIISEGGELQTFSGRDLVGIQKRRQELSMTYTRNGAIYAVRREAFIECENLLAPPCKAYIMANKYSVNIDTEEDFWIAERYLLQRLDEIETG